LGILDSMFEKHAEVNSQREKACAEAENFISQTQNHFELNSTQFIEMKWIDQVREQCKSYTDKINDLSSGALFSRTKMVSVRKRLEDLAKNIEDNVQHHNEKVAVLMIADGRKIVGAVEGRQLDNQQMTCIVKPAHNHLVIAGAGTGKTTTIIGKVKYLLNSGKCKPEDILVLSYTNASATEMSGRINNEAHCMIAASTFHKLGLDIISKVNGKVPKITKINLTEFSKQMLTELMKDNKYIELLCSFFLNNYKYSKTEHDFTTKNEYDEYLRLNPPTTLNGETVKSYGEMDIANFLFRNGVRYEYEKAYEVDTRTEDRAQYYPDFYLPDYGIYIEYFGISKDGKVPAYFSATGNADTASREYKEGMTWKRKVHKDNNTKLVECYAYEKSEGVLLENLSSKLLNFGVKFNPISAEQVWQKVADNNSKDVLSTIAELFATIITLIKSNNCSFEIFKSMCSHSLWAIRNAVVVSMIEPVYKAYDDALHRNGEIDFNDMINMASELIRSGKYVNQYKVVIVDEYQDISKARFNLLKALRDSSDYDLFCVGDDWQSIYRFAGSDMGYILNFQDFWGATVKSKIETTYRFSKSLIDVSGSFVMSNPAQIKKSIKGNSDDFGFALGEIKGYTEALAVKFMLQKLNELPANSSVYFIGRYSFDSKLLDGCADLKCKYDNEHGVVDVTYSKRLDLKMTFITAHRSKGLQADYVFIINNKHKGLGFPSAIQDDPIIEILLEGKESYPFAEERRLFYVALTRAKKKSYILTVEGNESVFAKELTHLYEKELKQERFICPECGGKLERKSGQYGDFYGCSNYRVNGCKYVRKIEGRSSASMANDASKAGENTASKTELKTVTNTEINSTGNAAASVPKQYVNASLQRLAERDAAMKSVSSTNMQTAPKCPNCGKDLVMRCAKNGANAGKQFYGCSGYPGCRYTRNL